jgi:hypothetical protein
MSLAHWPQPTRETELDAAGLGAGLTDFEAYASSDPNFAAAWADINGQLTLEGADTSQINLAKTALVTSFQQLASDIGVSGDEAIASAKSYVMMGQTVIGAATTVQGLIQAAETGSFLTITQAFTGTLIGLAVTAGAFSAGVGAAIVGAVGALLGILQNAGFFGTPSLDVQIPGCGWFYSKPNYLIGCVGAFNVFYCSPTSSQVCVTPIQQAPGSVNWRLFPNPNSTTVTKGATDQTTSDSDQSVWYRPQGNGLWKGLRWDIPGTLDHPDDRNKRLVDLAFPNYQYVEALASGNEFQKAFFGAWKTNAEYALNGLKMQADELVLIHLLRLWNRSHQGPAVALNQSNDNYVDGLVMAALSQLSASDSLVSGQSLLVNMGPTKTMGPNRHVIALHHVGNLRTAVSAMAPVGPGMSTGAKVAVGGAAIGGAALLGTAAYAFAKGQAVDTVLSHAWKHVKGWFHR